MKCMMLLFEVCTRDFVEQEQWSLRVYGYSENNFENCEWQQPLFPILIQSAR